MRCLYCGREMSGKISEMERESGWHKRCVKAFFGTNTMPILDLTEDGLLQLAARMTGKGLTVPGVQKKLSLHLSQDPDCRLTIVDYPTGYILKPQTSEYPYLPEYEDLVMRQAKIAGIRTVPHALIRMGSENAYITRRVDRQIGHGQVQILRMIAGLIGKREKLAQQIDASFLPESEKEKMRGLMEDRIEVLM